MFFLVNMLNMLVTRNYEMFFFFFETNYEDVKLIFDI